MTGTEPAPGSCRRDDDDDDDDDDDHGRCASSGCTDRCIYLIRGEKKRGERTERKRRYELFEARGRSPFLLPPGFSYVSTSRLRIGIRNPTGAIASKIHPAPARRRNVSLSAPPPGS